MPVSSIVPSPRIPLLHYYQISREQDDPYEGFISDKGSKVAMQALSDQKLFPKVTKSFISRLAMARQWTLLVFKAKILVWPVLVYKVNRYLKADQYWIFRTKNDPYLSYMYLLSC